MHRSLLQKVQTFYRSGRSGLLAISLLYFISYLITQFILKLLEVRGIICIRL